MTDLTDTQRSILSVALRRRDKALQLPPNLRGAARQRVIGPLLAFGYVKEIPASGEVPIRRSSKTAGAVSLAATKAGGEIIRLVRRGGAAGPLSPPRPGSKLALVVHLLGRKQGASLGALTDATGWLPHTTRAALTTLRRRGYAIACERANQATTYRLVGRNNVIRE
jgi:hypothetical protein